ncbi:MAG: protein-(glutamine-N5) methyltransferase, release factor-specific [Bacteroidia bacterium]|nr:MAG: protein-(glutamine-N5) methyltransferase, release factor-specific [Bacteroidia bacterium]
MKNTIIHIKNQLKDYYAAGEIEGFVKHIFFHFLGFSYSQIIIKQNELVLNEEEKNKVRKILSELKNYKPIQYILGESEFYDLLFHVDESVLIPRQETEELVHLIIQENRLEKPKILDIGTGSACIAVSLAKNIPASVVIGTDVSESALEIARKNAKRNSVDVAFLKTNILTWELHDEFSEAQFDIIVSNPPYVCRNEKQLMSKNVLAYEPHLALFVEDENPLIFYEKISNFALHALKPRGKLYFELNEQFGEILVAELEKIGFSDILLQKDINGKDRMLRGIAPEQLRI